MERLRETINPEETRAGFARTTRYRTETNTHMLKCRECGGLYYVDGLVFHRVIAALEKHLSKNPFCCDDCEEAYAEEAYSH